MEVNTPDIIHGVINDDFDEIKAALKNDPDCINQQNENRDTPAILAVKYEREEILKFLVAQKNIKKYMFNKQDQSLYSSGEYTKNKEIQKIAEGALETTLDDIIQDIMEDAEYKIMLARQEFALESTETPEIIKGVLSQDFDKVKGELANDSSSINQQNKDGLTAVMYAAKFKEVELFELFTSHGGIDTNLHDNAGNCLFDYAFQTMDSRIIKLNKSISKKCPIEDIRISDSLTLTQKPKF